MVVRWNSINATAATITHIGSVGLSGTVNVLPSSASKTVFTGTFSGPGGTVDCSGTVVVTSGSGSSGSTGSGGSNTGTTETTGSSYTTGAPYTVTSYTVNPSSFASNPTYSSFTQTPGTVTTGNTSNSNNSGSGQLVPCGFGASTDNATSCTICSLGQLIQNIINFLIMVSIPLSAIIFAYAGLLYFTAAMNPSRAKKAKEIFVSVFIGFAFAMAGYLIVQTLLNALLNSNFKSGGWSWQSLQCAGNRPRHNQVPDIFNNLVNSNLTASNVTGGGGDAVAASQSAAPLGETSARTFLARVGDGNVTVNSPCADGQTGCVTQLGGVQQTVLSAVTTIQATCEASASDGSCPLVVTGGSESHGGGASDPHAAGIAVDIRSDNGPVDAQMRTYAGIGADAANPTPSTSGAGYTAQIDNNNYTIYYEGNHWHLQLKQ